MNLKQSDLYRGLLEKATWSYAYGRSVFHIDQADVDVARLFIYAYRSQTIGAFHATREAAEAQTKASAGKRAAEYLERALGLLQQLESRAIDPVPNDFRAVISSLHFYDLWITQVISLLEAGLVHGGSGKLEEIKDRFITNLERVTAGNGLYTASDIRLPEQGSFVVPNLNIDIVPLIYGDHHSWNVAYMTAEGRGVAVHRHRKGAEIHLGFSPVMGRTILENRAARVEEGYAMPISPMTEHGFDNLSGHDHFLPFIFGSLVMGGWGILFDVEPRSGEPTRLKEVPLDSREMNHSIYLERAVHQAAAQNATLRRVLIPASAAGAPYIGGLQLTVARVDRKGLSLTSERYRIISVQKGKGKVSVGQVEAEVVEHDHFGIPPDIPAHISQVGENPLVVLDATIEPLDSTLLSS